MTINEIKATNKAAGKQFFSPSNMRFFDSKVEPAVYEGPGGVYFLTSELYHASVGDGTRRWTVRVFDPSTGVIDAFGPFNVLRKSQAVLVAKFAAEGGPEAATAMLNKLKGDA